MTKLSIKDLIDRKDKISGRKRKKETVYVEDLDGEIEIIEPTKGVMSDMDKNSDGDAMLIAECVVSPNLKSPELLKAYKCVTPIDLVHVMFRIGTIGKLSMRIVKLAGFSNSSIKIVEEIKN